MYSPSDKNLWYSPAKWIDYTSTDLFSETVSEIDKYMYYFYYSLMYLTLNEIGPVNEEQLLMCILSLIIASFVFTFLLGEMITLLTKLDKENYIT